jgi:hypothetical protein
LERNGSKGLKGGWVMEWPAVIEYRNEKLAEIKKF